MPAANTLLEENISHNEKTKYQFSCLTAVRYWYDDNTTAQNQNYGIMLQYADESIADYNAVYSADCTDATLRPTMTISYDPQKISIKEGSSCALSVSRSTGNAVWSSTNPEVATVNSSGLVTGIKAGCTTITARVNGVITKEYLVYVRLPDGLYYISNKATGYYLSAKNKDFNPGTRLIQAAKTTSSSNGRWQIWRINHITDGCYSIRPLHKQNMGLGYTTAVELQDIGISYSASEIGEDALWRISYSDGGYEMTNCGHTDRTLCSVNSQCDTAVTATSTSSAPIFRWLFESTSIQTDLILYTLDTESEVHQPRRGAAPGQSRTLEDINLTFSVSSGATLNQIVYWTSTNTSVATVDQYTGIVTGVTTGETTIRGTAWVNGSSYYETYTLVVSEIPISGSELAYEPGVWNSDAVMPNTNCYSYALNNQLYVMNPGADSPQGGITQNDITARNIVDYVKQDAASLGFMFEEINWDDCCATGSYKVALVVDIGVDYHWYSQNPDGTWSHKRGRTEAIDIDASNRIIYNPATANRQYSIADYDMFVGYFCVTPLNYYSVVEEATSISFDTNKANLPIYSATLEISEGMTYDEVTEILGEPQRQNTSGSTVLAYDLMDGEIFVVEYAWDGTTWVVYSCRLEV